MNYWFFDGWPAEEFEKWIRDRHDKDFRVDAKKGGLCLLIECDVGTRIAIWVRSQPRVKQLATLVHECAHAAHCTLDMRGFNPDFSNDEPVTYLIETIFAKALGK